MHLFTPGENCWRAERFNRFSYLIDGDAYYTAVKAALSRAERRIIILAWDFDNETRLQPNRRGPRRTPLGEYLLSLIEAKPNLEIYILVWWGSVFYGANKNLPISFGDEWWSHPRIHFRLDDHHPVSASHHQKIVSIDDKIAFVGGMDLTQGRWDESAHPDTCPHRCDTSSVAYGPTHDIQALVDGDAARAIAELAFERWRLVTGEILKSVTTYSSPWPLRVRPRVRGGRVAIARSQPLFGEQSEVREIEALNLDMLRAARRLIYIEQQYYTIPATNEILCEHLRREGGPEIILVINDVASGWIEQQAMFGSRDKLFALLQAADRFGRLRLVTPIASANPMCKIKIHSKLTIIDDRLARIGSSNFNQRSLGLDTECDLAIEATTTKMRRAVALLTYRLLAEHLDVRPWRVARLVRRHGSFVRAMDSLNKPNRGLLGYPRIDAADLPSGEALHPSSAIFDPPRSISFKYLWDWFCSRFRH